MPPVNESTLFALLIGIDKYSQVPLPDGSYYPHLGGCVRDIDHVYRMLRDRLGLPDDRITRLLSALSPSDTPGPLPTYENIVKAFKDVTQNAQAGDQVYIHYSGHGGRGVTMFPEIKGVGGVDESLVPCDIGENGACYLRDIEMSYLLKAMSEKGLIVTMVLDSCHSGGATRGVGGAVARGIDSIDTRPPLEESAVAAKADLLASFTKDDGTTTRNLNVPTGWRIGVPKNFVMIAACRANELASEYAFDGVERNGALTYWLLNSLNQITGGYSYKMLYNRIVAKVHAKFVNQTPQLEGDINREIFGAAQLSTPPSVNVLQVDKPNKRVQLNTGMIQGVGKGARFALYAPDATDLKGDHGRLAVVELDEIGSTETWARIVEGGDEHEIEEGAQAVLLGVGIRMRGRIRLVRQDSLPGDIQQETALEKLRDVIQEEGAGAVNNGWIRLAEEQEEADLQVAVNGRAEFEIWDVNGKTLPNLRPALKIEGADSAGQAAKRLVHLTKYRNGRLVDNTDPASPLAGKIIGELGKQTTGPDGGSVFQSFGIPARPLAVGEEAHLRITNLSGKPVNIAILDFQPDWGVSQAHPHPQTGQAYELLEPGDEKALLLPIGAWLPDDYQEGTDTLKIFASAEGTSFHWLEMPALDQPDLASRTTRNFGDPLEQLMEAFTGPNLTRQIINMSAPKAKDWATVTVEVKVRRPSIAHVEDPALSLLQSAFDMIEAQNGEGVKTRSVNGREQIVRRPELSNPIISDITQYCVAVAHDQLTEEELLAFDNKALNDAQERGVIDVAKYCASMAVGMAKTWFKRTIWSDEEKNNAYAEALTKRFGDCDPRYAAALKQFTEFLRNRGAVPYRVYQDINDYVIDGRLPEKAMIGVVADWATGEPEAIEVLRQVKTFNPQVAIHLGDIYYSGTEYEAENYFFKPWKSVLDLDNSGILSLALPGNHDLYAGGQPFYDLLDKLSAINGTTQSSASYFCLRNDHWQLIGLDTALNDRLLSGPTHLAETEVVWLKDKIENSGGRRTILFSHHQLFSCNDQWIGADTNPELYKQLESLLPGVDLWLWGHEHDLVIFDEYKGLRRGRCIGGSAFPVGNFEMPQTRLNPDVPYNKQVELSKGSAFYQHCYTMIELDGDRAVASYYEDGDGGKLLFQESI